MSWSEQQFADCDDTGLDCNVGLMDDAFAPDKKNGICTEGEMSIHHIRWCVLIVEKHSGSLLMVALLVSRDRS